MNREIRFTLHSEEDERQTLSCTLREPVRLPDGQRWGARLEGLSCPSAGKGGVLKVICDALDSRDKTLSVQALDTSPHGFHHRWQPSHEQIPLALREVGTLQLRLETKGGAAPARVGQPSTAAVRLTKMSRLRQCTYFFVTSGDREGSLPHRFEVALPSDVTLNRDRSYALALASITYNPYFRPLPFIYDTSDTYRATWTPLGGIASHIVKSVREMFPAGSEQDTTFGRAWHLIQMLLADPNREGGALCHVETAPPANGEPEPTSITVTWLATGTLDIPWPVLYLMGWDPGAGKLAGFASVTLGIQVGQRQDFRLSTFSEQAFQPKNLLLHTNCVEVSPVGQGMRPVLSTIPVTRQAKHREDYVSHQPTELEFHSFKFPEQDVLTFELKTPAGNYASFADQTSTVYMTLALRCVF